MNIQEIKGLLDQFDQSSLTEFDLKEGNFELYFNKNTSSGKERLYATPAAETPAIGGTQLQTTSTHEETTETIVTEEAKAEGTSIVSPLVGVVYLQPTPEKPAFKKLGDQVKKAKFYALSKP